MHILKERDCGQHERTLSMRLWEIGTLACVVRSHSMTPNFCGLRRCDLQKVF